MVSCPAMVDFPWANKGAAFFVFKEKLTFCYGSVGAGAFGMMTGHGECRVYNKDSNSWNEIFGGIPNKRDLTVSYRLNADTEAIVGGATSIADYNSKHVSHFDGTSMQAQSDMPGDLGNGCGAVKSGILSQITVTNYLFYSILI